MSGQKYLRTNFDDDDDNLVDTSPSGMVAVSGALSPTTDGGSGDGGGLDGARQPSAHVSIYATTVAFGGVDSGPAVCLSVCLTTSIH